MDTSVIQLTTHAIKLHSVSPFHSKCSRSDIYSAFAAEHQICAPPEPILILEALTLFETVPSKKSNSASTLPVTTTIPGNDRKGKESNSAVKARSTPQPRRPFRRITLGYNSAHLDIVPQL